MISCDLCEKRHGRDWELRRACLNSSTRLLWRISSMIYEEFESYTGWHSGEDCDVRFHVFMFNAVDFEGKDAFAV